MSRTDGLAEFCARMNVELYRAEKAWPDGEIYVRLAALAGEVGELAQGTIKGRPVNELYDEAVQVAVTAFRAARVLVRASPAVGTTDDKGPA